MYDRAILIVSSTVNWPVPAVHHIQPWGHRVALTFYSCKLVTYSSGSVVLDQSPHGLFLAREAHVLLHEL